MNPRSPALPRSARTARPGVLLAALLAALFAAASATAAAEAPDDDLEALLALLDEETELATKTRMNTDFVPGVLTVLDGERLAGLGARTVWDAMPFVPGVQAVLDPRGTPTVTVRGIHFPFNSGSIQILLNGVPVGREDTGLNGSLLFLPITQVERLEFIRGPGSVLYGDFAFQGLLNIITRADLRQVALTADDHGERGANLIHARQVGDWRLAANLAARQTDDAFLPQPRSGEERRRSGVLQAARDGLQLQLHGIERRLYNLRGGAPDPGVDETTWGAALRHDLSLRPALDARLQLQYLDTEILTGAIAFAGRQARAGFELDWTGWSRQQWLAGVEWTEARVDWARFTGAPPPRPPGAPPPPPGPTVQVADRARQIASVFVQDQIELTPALRATLGLRYDDNNAIGARLTPRGSLVWQAAERHVLKLQCAEGYRAPTFFELYTDGATPNALDFEVNATTELTWIHRRPGSTARITLFRSRITDMVFRDFQRARFGNVGRADADGVELEYTRRVGDRFELSANLSHADAHDNRNPQLIDRPIGSTPDWMGNLGLLWQPSQALSLGLRWNHIDERPAATLDDGRYDRVDLSLTRRDLFAPGLDLRLGVDNLFDERIVQLHTQPNSVINLDYRERVAWVELGWRY